MSEQPTSSKGAGFVNPSPIQTGTDTWIIMREYRQQPKAIVHRITTTDGTPRYLLMTWEPIAADRRLVSMHPSLDEADAAVPWPTPESAATPPGPGHPEAVYAAHREQQRRTAARTARRSGQRVPVDPVPPEQSWR